MSPVTRDRLGSLLMLAFIAILWVQRDYTSPLGGMFPDTIMIIMALFVALALILSFTKHPAMADATRPGEDDETAAGGPQLRRVLVVSLILALWVWLYEPVGFVLTALLGFASIAAYLGDRSRPMREVGRALVLGAAVSFVVWLVFDYFLLVPLPGGFLFGS